MLCLIGLGISGDITLNGRELAKKADEVYCEFYTGILQKGFKGKLEKLIGKKIKTIKREKLESNFIVKRAVRKNVALLVPGDPLSATTHYTLVQDAKKLGIKIKIVHNSSIFTSATGKCGLQHYKFGKTATLANWKQNYKPVSALEIVEENLKSGLHTLLLLDLDEGKPMDAKTAFAQIEKIELKLGRKIIGKLIVLSRLGWNDEKIVYGGISELKNVFVGKPPFCFIVPGRLHFAEEENLEEFKNSD